MMFKQQNMHSRNPKMNIGSAGERFIQNMYQKEGFTLVSKNAYFGKGKRVGEIDLIVRTPNTIVFIEVKTRSHVNSAYGNVKEAIALSKLRKIRKTIDLFMLYHPQFRNLQPRIDVCFAVPRNIDKTDFYVTIISNAELE